MTARNAERNEKIERDYSHGKSAREIGEEWGITTQRVYQILRNERYRDSYLSNIKLKPARTRRKLNETDRAMIRAGLESLEKAKPELRRYTRRAAVKMDLTLRNY